MKGGLFWAKQAYFFSFFIWAFGSKVSNTLHLFSAFFRGGECTQARTPWFDLWTCFRSIRSSVMEWTCFAPHPLKPSRTFPHQAITTVTDLIVIRVLVSKKKWVQGEVLKNLKDSPIFKETCKRSFKKDFKYFL